MVEHFLQGQILFGQVSPEVLLQSLLNNASFCRKTKNKITLDITSYKISETSYLHFSRMFAGNARKTIDEQIQRYRELEAYLNCESPGGFFRLLADYGDQVLNLTAIDPKVKQERILEWREVSLAFGQDFFTCAALAKTDVHNKTQRFSFSWPPAVQTDNIPLRHLLEGGCSENHYHLNGSTQIFPIAWCYLMNHPSKLTDYFASRELQDGLNVRTSTSILDNINDWVEKMYMAVWIRIYLFSQITERYSTCEVFQSLREYFCCPDRTHQLCSIVEQYRWNAARLPQGRKRCCLDYAITTSLAEINRNPTRLLVGERNLLYQCFYRCYSGKFTDEQMDLLYLYLLIKRDFRNELVQTNGKRGFWNFANYQDRKNLIWAKSPDYLKESLILSLVENLTCPRDGKPTLQSLEARISPKLHPMDLLSMIRSIDCFIEEYCEWQAAPTHQPVTVRREKSYLMSAQETAKYFYVLHFTKKPLQQVAQLKRKWTYWLPARNDDVRRKAKYQAKALARGLSGSSYLCSRIRGIDACSREIGCRPETFATQFRYLRGNLITHPYSASPLRYWPKLSATYHVGEDFLDLTDGLRAIDEAICFLNLGQGDRLGHAMALGVSPQQYYRTKDYSVWLPAQDLLDNLVWLLYRSLEWDVDISSALRERLRERAQQLLNVIYPSEVGQANPVTLRNYYEAWQLRGDDPKLYWEYQIGDEDTRYFLPNSLPLWDDSYSRAMLNVQKDEDGVDICARLRTIPLIRRMLIRYHFGFQERQNGEKIVRFVITPDFVTTLEKLQIKMMEKIMVKGIAIECNPSSNHLIGTFDRYEQHPIFRFNHFGLRLPKYDESSKQLRVSVNTDDLGVFDTSIENEYALLFGALCAKRDSEGNMLFSHDEILSYIEHLRIMGNDMTFPKAENTF